MTTVFKVINKTLVEY